LPSDIDLSAFAMLAGEARLRKRGAQAYDLEQRFLEWYATHE
jgi:hypothetical protein